MKKDVKLLCHGRLTSKVGKKFIILFQMNSKTVTKWVQYLKEVKALQKY